MIKQFAAGRIGQRGQFLFRHGEVPMWEDMDLGPGQTAAIDDRGMIQGIRDDVILRPEDRRDRAGIGSEAGLEDDARLDILEAGDLFLEIQVNLHRARDGAHGSCARAEFASRAEWTPPPAWDDSPARGNCSRREVNHLLVVEDADRAAGAIEFAQALKRAGRRARIAVDRIGTTGDW